MKKILAILAGLAALIAAGQFSGCKSDKGADESEEKVFMNKLARTWNVSGVSVDGQDVTGAFTGLKITFTQAKAFTVQNAVPPIWPGNGNIELVKAGSTFSLQRNDGVIITVVQLNDTSLIMKFIHNAGGRASSVSGDFTFIMSPN